MAKFGATILLVLSLGLAVPLSAQNLDMRVNSQASTFDQAGKPTRGMTRTSVEANFGSPQSVTSPVGDPPISRWEYTGFVVFFEYDRVIHAVSKRHN
jgi:hypothetical protein